MSAAPANPIRTGRVTRVFLYLVLQLFALFYLLPLYVMVTNALKPLSGITGGDMLVPPRVWTLEAWRAARSTAQIDDAGSFRIFWRILLPSSGPIIVVSIIWQFTNIWNDFLFGASFADCLHHRRQGRTDAAAPVRAPGGFARL